MMAGSTSAPVGLIAGGGRLPILVAEGMKAAGRPVCCVALRDHAPEALQQLCDVYEQAGILQPGRWIRLLRRRGVQDAVLVGGVAKTRMHDPLRLLRQLPDWRAARVYYRRLRSDRRNNTLLNAVADELARGGVRLIDSTAFIGGHLAAAGCLTRCRPAPGSLADVQRGWPILQRMADLDIGQSVAVCDGRVIAVEAVEGTDAMIRRAATLCGGRAWTLLKGPRHGHDMRFDVPVVGPGTIGAMAAGGARCLAVAVGRVIMLDRPALLESADRAGISVVGVDADGAVDGRSA